MNTPNKAAADDTKAKKAPIGKLRSLIIITVALTMIWMTRDIVFQLARPDIESVPTLTGRWIVEGEMRADTTSRRARFIWPNYFVETEAGRIQVHCGLRTQSQSCVIFDGERNLLVKIWYHSRLGILQLEVLPTPAKPQGEMVSYEKVWELTFASTSNSQGDGGPMLLGFFGGIGMLLLGIHHFWRACKFRKQTIGKVSAEQQSNLN